MLGCWRFGQCPKFWPFFFGRLPLLQWILIITDWYLLGRTGFWPDSSNALKNVKQLWQICTHREVGTSVPEHVILEAQQQATIAVHDNVWAVDPPLLLPVQGVPVHPVDLEPLSLYEEHLAPSIFMVSSQSYYTLFSHVDQLFRRHSYGIQAYCLIYKITCLGHWGPGWLFQSWILTRISYTGPFGSGRVCWPGSRSGTQTCPPGCWTSCQWILADHWPLTIELNLWTIICTYFHEYIISSIMNTSYLP